MLAKSLNFLFLLCSYLVFLPGAVRCQSGHQYYLAIGTYSPADSNGIFIYRFNTGNGEAQLLSTVSGIANPSYLTFSPDRKYIYSVSETQGAPGGKVYAYSFDRQQGRLKYINQQPSNGKSPCHVIEDATGHWVMVANYSSGNFSVFPVTADGGVGPAISTIQHEGHGVNPQRQAGPHVHFVNIAPNNKDVFVSDLGLDEVVTYELNTANGQLTPGHPPFAKVSPGAGPRHQVFSPNGKFMYLIQEMGGTITAFRYEPGKLTTVQTVFTTPPGFKGRIWTADIHLSPDGKFLYGSNRDDLNDIVIFSVNPRTGKLTYVGRQSSGGKTPRNFVITPDGKYLLAAHQNSNDIIIFKRDSQTGLLTPTGQSIPVPHAVCLKMIPE